MSVYKSIPFITKEYLKDNPNHIFVFGDNLIRRGKGGAAKLRDEPNTYGFITKRAPNNNDRSFYKLHEYLSVFEKEFDKLIKTIKENPDKTFLISKIGAGLANKYEIWNKIISPRIGDLSQFDNVMLLFRISKKGD